MDSLFLRRPIYSIGCALVAYGGIWELNQALHATTEFHVMWATEVGKYGLLFLLFRAYKIGVEEWLVFALVATLFRISFGLGPVVLASVFLLNRLINLDQKG